jgi:hypothetical protein
LRPSIGNDLFPRNDFSSCTIRRRKKEEGRRKKEEGRRKKEEERRKKKEGRRKKEEKRRKKEEKRRKKNNWFPGCAWEPMSRGSASRSPVEAEPLDLHYQAEPGNE